MPVEKTPAGGLSGGGTATADTPAGGMQTGSPPSGDTPAVSPSTNGAPTGSVAGGSGTGGNGTGGSGSEVTATAAGSGDVPTASGSGSGTDDTALGGSGGTSAVQPTAAGGTSSPVVSDAGGGGAVGGGGVVYVTVTTTQTITVPDAAPTDRSGSAGSAPKAVVAFEKMPAPLSDPLQPDQMGPQHGIGSLGAASSRAGRQDLAYGTPGAMTGGKHLNLVRDHKIRAAAKAKRSW